MIVRALRAAGMRSDHFQLAGSAGVALSLSLWIRAKTLDQDERGNAERRAIFVGLWPGFLWLVGDALQRED